MEFEVMTNQIIFNTVSNLNECLNQEFEVHVELMTLQDGYDEVIKLGLYECIPAGLLCVGMYSKVSQVIAYLEKEMGARWIKQRGLVE
jgi:hypothetical protein